MVDWVQTIVILVSFFGGFLYLLKDGQEIRREIRGVEKSLEDKIQEAEKTTRSIERHLLAEIKSMDLKISNIEGQITQMTRPNVIPFGHDPKRDDPKEN